MKIEKADLRTGGEITEEREELTKSNKKEIFRSWAVELFVLFWFNFLYVILRHLPFFFLQEVDVVIVRQ